MDIPTESFRILGILCYLNYPQYLNKTNILSVQDIFDKMEEEIEELSVEVEELENNYRQVQLENDKLVIFNKINNKKKQIIELKNHLKLLKI